MAGNVDAQSAQLLNQTPDFGPAGRNLLRDLCTADDDRRVLHEQTHDQSEAQVSGLKLVRARLHPRGFPYAHCACLADAEIICESQGNDKCCGEPMECMQPEIRYDNSHALHFFRSIQMASDRLHGLFLESAAG